MIYIGIDVGKNGGYSIFDGNTNTIIVKAWDKESFISDLRAIKKQSVATVEQVHAMPSQGVVSMFSFGELYGYVQGVLDALQIKYSLVRPSVWKKHFDLIKTNKKASINKAKELYPDVSFRKNSRCRTDHDGMAESLLIMLYGKGNA